VDSLEQSSSPFKEIGADVPSSLRQAPKGILLRALFFLLDFLGYKVFAFAKLRFLYATASKQFIEDV